MKDVSPFFTRPICAGTHMLAQHQNWRFVLVFVHGLGWRQEFNANTFSIECPVPLLLQ